MTRSHTISGGHVCGFVRGIGGLSFSCFPDSKHLSGASIVISPEKLYFWSGHGWRRSALRTYPASFEPRQLWTERKVESKLRTVGSYHLCLVPVSPKTPRVARESESSNARTVGRPIVNCITQRSSVFRCHFYVLHGFGACCCQAATAFGGCSLRQPKT
jgi:hypothetical protein